MVNRATLCIDVGGTFTDYVMLFNDDIITFKLPTETKNLENVISNFLNSLKIDLNIKELIYVSTIASNLLLGQLGIAMPKVCLITTKGFRDAIEIGRQNRPELYNLFFEKKKPLVERRYRFEVNERVDSKGKIIKEVDEKEIEEIAKIIIQNKIESVAICYINSYVNPFNEFKTKELLKKLIPYNIYIVTSHEICPEIGEYERFSTTVLNAMLMPVMSSHMDKLLEEAKKRKIKKFYVMGSIGGLLSYDKVYMKPVFTIESGPIAGILGSLYLSRIYNLDNVVSFDMGGTTAKSSLIQNFSPFITTEYEFDARRIGGRSLKGTGYPIKIPFIDVVEVSAGGGTIVWIDETNSLRVGPLSAGAKPGPACYGKSLIPTITDANLILGRLSEKLLGGNMIVYKERSIKAFEKLSKNLGLSIEETAYSAIKLINFKMGKAIKIIAVERGIEPSKLTLIAYGGAGPMHACEICEELGMKNIIIPRYPGLFSSFSLLFSDIKYVYSSNIIKKLEDLKVDEIDKKFKELENLAKIDIKNEELKEIIFQKYLDVRYYKQSYELLIPIENIDKKFFENVKNAFYKKHKEIYGWSYEAPVEIVNIRLYLIGIRDKPTLKKYELSNEKAREKDVREVYFNESFIKTKIYWRENLKAGYEIEGPAIIEQYDSTVVIPPNWVCFVDEYLNLRIKK